MNIIDEDELIVSRNEVARKDYGLFW